MRRDREASQYMNVVIVEDMENDEKHLEQMLRENSRINDIYDGKQTDKLLQLLKDYEIDLVLMDIELEEQGNGIELAEQIYRISPTTQVIFVTHYEDYIEDIFLKDIHLSGYLRKPVDQAYLDQLIEKIFTKKQKMEDRQRQEYYSVVTKNEIYRIRIDDILYVESKAHQVTIVCENEEICCYQKLQTMKEQLGERFAQSHKSYLVNMDKISRIKGENVLLKNEKIIPVSRARLTEFKKLYYNYIQQE